MKFLGLEFPKEIGGSAISDFTNYEARAPGLGYSVKYARQGWAIDVYIYDKKKVVPDDPESEVVEEELDSSVQDIYAHQTNGMYEYVEYLGPFGVMDYAENKRFIGARLYLIQQGEETDSTVVVGGWRGKFVKLRITTPGGQGQEEAEVNAFIDDWMTYLWPDA